MTVRSDKNARRFDRVAVVLPGGGALAAYQAGALAAMEAAAQQPSWLAGTGAGAFNAAIVAGNPPGQRAGKLLDFWRRLGDLARRNTPSNWATVRRRLAASIDEGARRAPGLGEAPRASPIDSAKLVALVAEMVDFRRINSGLTRLTLGTTHLATGADIFFDNDRHKIGLDHVMACVAMPGGTPPVVIADESYGVASVLAVNPLSSLLDSAPPADTLCFIIDSFDPAPPGLPGSSRSGQQIAAYRRHHDLRRVIAQLGEKMPAELRRDPEIRRWLAQGANSTMNLVHLVQEGGAAALAEHLADFSWPGLARRWRAGERDMVASLARSGWLAPPPRRIGVVVHEMRGSAARSRIR